MIKIGFIGTELDIQKRAPLFINAYGESNLTVLQSKEGDENFKTIDTVEDLVQLNDIVVIESGAAQNLNLLYHTIKKGNKLFLDIDKPMSLPVIQKCKAYQEEAGNSIAFNVSPYYGLLDFFNKDLTRQTHIHLTNMAQKNNLVNQVYQFLVFGCIFLECDNIHASYQIMPGSNNEIRAIAANLNNLQEKYLHVLAGDYKETTNQFMIYNQNYFKQGSLPEKQYFDDADILKKQLNALYKSDVKGDLHCLNTVVAVLAKLKDSVEKKGFYL